MITKLLYRATGRKPAHDAPADRRQLGAHAKRLIDDPVLALAFDRIERDLVDSLLNSTVGDTEAREAAYRLHWATEQLRAKLRAMLGDAKVIEAEQARQDKMEARRRERAVA